MSLRTQATTFQSCRSHVTKNNVLIDMTLGEWHLGGISADNSSYIQSQKLMHDDTIKVYCIT